MTFEYITHGPLQGPANKLVVLFHGYGYDAAVMKVLAERIARQMPQAQIVMPHAPEKFDIPANQDGNMLKVPKQLFDKTGAPSLRRQWFSINGDLKILHDRLAKLAPKVNAFIDNQRDMLGLGNKDIAIMGFSQGGGVALFSAYARPEPVGCVVGHSTIFVESAALKSKPPTLFVYGNADEEFSQSRYAQVIAAMRRYLPVLETRAVEGLTHKTSSESRKLTADFITRKLVP